MLSKWLLPMLLSVASASSVENTVSATSIVSCNPLSATTCSPDPALATGISDDFQEESSYYVPYRTPTEIFYGSDGLTLTLSKRFDNPSLVSDFYIMFGKVEVWLKSANGTGIISSFYLQSDDLDEIDMEWFGGDASQMQSNFFSKGDTSTYDRGEYHTMADPRESFHNYTLDWNEDSLSWYIDGTLVRTLASTNSEGYPQTPMRLFFGIWAGGDSSNAAGTIEWAGGSTDYSDAPFSMHINSLVVVDYSSGSEYSYDGTDGTWDSIKASGGSVNGRKDVAIAEFDALVSGHTLSSNSASTTASSSATASSSSSSSSSTSSSSQSASQSDASTSASSTAESSESSSTSQSTGSVHNQGMSVSAEHQTDTSQSLTASPSMTMMTSTTESNNASSSSLSTSSLSLSSKDENSSITVSTDSNAAGSFNKSQPSLIALLLLVLSFF